MTHHCPIHATVPPTADHDDHSLPTLQSIIAKARSFMPAKLKERVCDATELPKGALFT
jgi:hypothetical protein